MAAPAKLLHVIGLLCKEESTYGTAVSLTTTADGVQLQYKDRNQGAPMEHDYAFDGGLGPSVSNLGQVARVASSGFSVKGDLPTRARPGGTAYSASIFPSIHRLLKAAGFDAALTTSVGSEKWLYTPTAPGNGYTSLTMGLYTRGELWSAAGVIGNLKFDATDPAPPIFTFNAMGIATLPSDASAPSITYPLQSVAPPLASAIVFSMGSLSTNAVVKSVAWDLQREMTPRVALTAAGGHLGFVPGDRKPICKVVLEATALVGTPYTSSTAFDPYQLKDKGTVIAVALQFGSTQYFKWTMNFPQCTVMDVKPGNDGALATVELTLAAHNSTASSADDVNFVFD